MRILIIFIVQTVFITTVSAQTIENITGEVYEITVEKVFVRKAPGNYSKNLGVLQKGDLVIMLKDGKKWPEVKLSNGNIGYVFHRCMKKIESYSGSAVATGQTGASSSK